MSRSLSIVRPAPENLHILPSTSEPSVQTRLIAPSLGQLSEWKTWPPALAMVDQVIPFVVKTSAEFLALQRIVNHSLRGLSLYVELSEFVVDSAFMDQRLLIPTNEPETYLVNLYGLLQHFFSCLHDRPLTIKRHDYNARTLEAVENDFYALDIPVVTLEIPPPKASPRPEKMRTAPWHPHRLPDLTTSQGFQFTYRFWDVMTESDDDLTNLFVMNRLLELSIGRRELQPFTTTVDIIQYGQKGFSIGLPDLGSSAYLQRAIQQSLDEGSLRAFNVRKHQTNPHAYYVQLDPIIKKHCRS